MCRNTESFQLNKGPVAYKRVFLTHKNTVKTAVKQVSGKFCTTESEKLEVLRADLEQSVSLCLHNSFSRNREKKVNVVILPCCKQRLLRQKMGHGPQLFRDAAEGAGRQRNGRAIRLSYGMEVGEERTETEVGRDENHNRHCAQKLNQAKQA